MASFLAQLTSAVVAGGIAGNMAANSFLFDQGSTGSTGLFMTTSPFVCVTTQSPTSNVSIFGETGTFVRIGNAIWVGQGFTIGFTAGSSTEQYSLLQEFNLKPLLNGATVISNSFVSNLTSSDFFTNPTDPPLCFMRTGLLSGEVLYVELFIGRSATNYPGTFLGSFSMTGILSSS